MFILHITLIVQSDDIPSYCDSISSGDSDLFPNTEEFVDEDYPEVTMVYVDEDDVDMGSSDDY